MNKIMKTAMSMAAVASLGLLTACDQDQSRFDVDLVPDHAVVMGTVSYNQGTTVEGGRFAYQYQPAAGLPVIITITNSAYDGNLRGKTRFETVTDENGKYSLEIPVPDAAAQVTVTTGEFEGVHTSVQRVNNKLETVTDNVVYGGQTSAGVQPYGYVYADIVCTEKSREQIAAGFSNYAELKGVVGIPAEQSLAAVTEYNYQTGLLDLVSAPQRICFFKGGNNIDVLVTIEHDGVKNTYNATTGSNGEFSLSVPVSEFPATFSYEVVAMPYKGTLTHYYQKEKDWTLTELAKFYADPANAWSVPYRYEYVACTLDGYYTQSEDFSGSLTYSISDIYHTVRGRCMQFNAYDNQDNHDYSTSLFNGAPWEN